MGLYEIREHIPGPDDESNIFHPRFEGDGIPKSDTFHSVIHERLEKSRSDMTSWCSPSAWFNHAPQCDFRVKNAYGYICGLPVIVPTCPKKLFAKGPRKKYVDIVTDTLHASSSDLITWNTLGPSHDETQVVQLHFKGMGGDRHTLIEGVAGKG